MKTHIHSPKTNSPERGFTLIELLTVIAIIGILASILIPVVGKVRESARASACVSQLRDLGLGVHLYAEDNGDFIPPNVNPNTGNPSNEWGSYVQDRSIGLLLSADKGGPNIPGWSADFLDSAHLLYCPASKDDLFQNTQYKRPDDIGPDNRIVRSGYMWIYRAAGDIRENARTTVENPNRPYVFDFPAPGTGGLSDVFTVNPHDSIVNVLHVGGHVTSVKISELEKTRSANEVFDYLTFKDHTKKH